MKSFRSIIVEATASEEKLKHLEHAEDHILNAGAEGYAHAAKTLHAVSNAMQGKASNARITTKYDGSPSIVFGHHPETGKFFVATKSAFNANPKLNYTTDDIERNHGHAPGLVEKLKDALKHLPKVAPDKGIYQGDIMHSGSKDVKKRGDEYHFTPNTITYTTKQGSPEGRKIAASKLGVVVHTQYKGKDFESMKAHFDVNQKSFKEHPDVHMVSPEVDATGSHFDKKTLQAFDEHMANAEATHKKLAKGGYEAAMRHADTLKMFINKNIKDETQPTAEGFKQYVDERGQKDIAKLKTEAGKATRLKAHNLTLQQLDQDKKHIKTALELHSHLQKAKDTLVHAITPAAQGAFGTKIGDQEAKPEGAVVTIDGRPTKLVDRAEFSKANFQRGEALKVAKEKEKEKAPAQEEKHGVLAFGRMNPPTAGHAVVAQKVLDIAKDKNAADHRVVLSAASAPEKETPAAKKKRIEKDPLTSDQKVKHALRLFPTESHVEAATKDKPTILHHAADMYKRGITHLHVVAGSDRQKEYQDLLDKYNGVESRHGTYNFKSITVHSSGERDPDSEGVEGMSASKMRELASSGKKKEFHNALPDKLDKKHKDELYSDVRKGMGLQELFVRAITGRMQKIHKIKFRGADMKLRKDFPGKSASSGGGE